MRFMIAVTLFCGSLAPAQSPEPALAEIELAYRSKAAQSWSFIPGLSREHRRIREARGWRLKFKRLSEDRTIGTITLRYRAVARKGDTCAEYLIIERLPRLHGTPQARIGPGPRFEKIGVGRCR